MNLINGFAVITQLSIRIQEWKHGIVKVYLALTFGMAL